MLREQNQCFGFICLKSRILLISSVAVLHHFYAAPGKNFDAAPGKNFDTALAPGS
jgi:hypothetical protein